MMAAAGWRNRKRKTAGALELKSCASDERKDVAGNSVSARAATAPVIPVTIVAAKPTPMAPTCRHCGMKVKLPARFDNQTAVSDNVASSKRVLPRYKQRNRIRPLDRSPAT